MENTFGDVFYIIKGQYRRVSPVVTVPASGKHEAVTCYLGGYDPESPDTHEWYMLMDTDTHGVHCASANLVTVLEGLYNVIIKYHTRAKMVAVTREHMTRTSYIQETTDLEVYKKYGGYYKDLCAMVCERACKDIPDITVRRMGNVFQQRALNRALESLDPRKAAQEVLDLWNAKRHEAVPARKVTQSPVASENFAKGRGGLFKYRRALGVRKTFPKA